MATDIDRLPQLLAQLKSQLAAATSVDEETRRQLETTIGDVERLLGGQFPEGARSPKSARAESLAGRLGETAADFEASHPTLAVTVSGIIDALGNLGI